MTIQTVNLCDWRARRRVRLQKYCLYLFVLLLGLTLLLSGSAALKRHYKRNRLLERLDVAAKKLHVLTARHDTTFKQWQQLRQRLVKFQRARQSYLSQLKSYQQLIWRLPPSARLAQFSLHSGQLELKGRVQNALALKAWSHLAKQQFAKVTIELSTAHQFKIQLLMASKS